MALDASSFCRDSFLVPNSTRSSSFSSRITTNRELSLFFLKMPSLRSTSVSSSRRLQVSAGLKPRSPKQRRNLLREKLVAREAQVREILKHSNSGLDSSQTGSDSELSTKHCQTNLVEDEKGAGNGGDSSDRPKVAGESVLWNKLESWVDQYKKDNEFWGIGTGPIFTIYQNSDGDIARVSVNEDEIIRRSQFEALPLQLGQAEEDLDVNLKISRAKLIAKDILSGVRKLPKNSSIAKFVVEGQKVSYVEGFRSAVHQGKNFLKFSPQVGLTVLCGYFLFWVMKKSLAGNDRIELTMEEKEMLRRKLKARKDRNMVNKGTVEVLQDAPELPAGFDKRPELDRDELMKNLVKAKASKHTSMMLDSSSSSPVYGRSFEDKVREIREMAREARESERQELQSNKKGEAKHVSVEKNNLVPDLKNLTGEFPKDIQKPGQGIKKDDFIPGSKEEKETSYTSLDNSPSSSKSSTTVKPKIIRSVEEAREYLSQKHEFPKDKVLSRQDILANGLPESNSDELNGNKSWTVHKGSEAVDNPKTNPGVKKRVLDSIKNTNPGGMGSARSTMEMDGGTLDLEKDSDLLKNSADRKYEKNRSNDAIEYLSPMQNSQRGYSRHDFLEGDTENIDSQSEGNDSVSGVEGLTNDVEDAPQKKEINTSKASSFLLLSDEREEKSNLATSDKPSSPTTSSPLRNPGITKPFKESSFSKISPSLTDDGSNVKENKVKSAQLGNEFSHPPTVEDINDKEKMRTCEENTVTTSSPLRNNLEQTLLSSVVEKECVEKSFSQFPPNPDGTPDDLESFAIHDAATAQRDDAKPDQATSGISESDADFYHEPGTANHQTVSELAEGTRNWIGENFQKFEPVIEKIGVGFRKNYKMARENLQEQKITNKEISELGLMEDDELEWMKDDKLRDIVFKVQDNELAGRDPFHSLSADDQHDFFKGLERKAEKVNRKLLGLHEWIHSRVENIDYAADGISLNDPPEKIIPRWKGPPVDKIPEFLNNPVKNEKGLFAGDTRKSSGTDDDTADKVQKSEELSLSDGGSPYSSVHSIKKTPPNGAFENPRTVIEGSDGSIRIGKKGGKEHWQHTKKWSREFLEVYNAETDPEIKSVMKDMGKDLDKWISEKEIQDTADLMTRIPKKKRKFIEKKLDKLKNEMAMFGPQAVVSKYREYSEEKEEDYLWWLDLKYILCIELYTVENDTQKVGFYSLEMAADLELNPKQYHVIAFEDPGDSKNFCYIMQAHLEMIGKGSAFVVARPPKDAFQEAKVNGFHVTVIRKGELKLNIDRTLEEVKEEITDIGSKMYHDKIMHERSVDIGAVMKGVFASSKSAKRKRPKQKRKKPAAP